MVSDKKRKEEKRKEDTNKGKNLTKKKQRIITKIAKVEKDFIQSSESKQ